MTKNILGYATHSAISPLEAFQFQRRALRKNDVNIEILYCGVCHSDLHQARNDWGNSIYPMVPGHEVVGKVIGVGADVKKFKLGDTVGVGCMVDSCQICAACEQDLEQYCEDGNTPTYNGIDRHDKMPTMGGYSERVVVSDKFVLKVPTKLDLKGVAPLLCAGITTWSPLKHWNIGKGNKIAVIGLGGLGHMALKLANALGAHVTLFTRSPVKEADARRLGAHEVVISSNAEAMLAVSGKFDLILDTVPNMHDLNPYLDTLSLNGTLVMVGYLGELKPALNTIPLIMGRKAVAGSLIGGIAETQKMLKFCGKHGITADVEMIDIQKINEAYERMLKSDVKYRFVIDMKSLKV